MVRIIAGQGFLITAKPPALAGRLLPSRSTTSASTPRNGRVADPGLSGTQGRGVTRIMPVSVCHQVSMIGLSPPVARWNHSHASGLIGSPTLPRMRREERSYFFGHSSPYFINRRMAVGVV